MVLYHASCRVVFVADIIVDFLLWHLNEHYVGNAVSDFKATKLEGGPVVC